MYDKENGIINDIPSLTYIRATKHFTLKNTEKRISTIKSLPQNKSNKNKNTNNHKTIKNNDDKNSEDKNSNDEEIIQL